MLLPTVVLKPAQKSVQTYRERDTLLCSSGFQITFLGASELCSHESEAEGKEEENRGGRKLSRWGWGFLPQVNRSSSALICLVSWGKLCKLCSASQKGLKTTNIFYNPEHCPSCQPDVV